MRYHAKLPHLIAMTIGLFLFTPWLAFAGTTAIATNSVSTIVGVNAGLCLGIKDSSSAAQATLQSQTCTGSDFQKWKFIKDSAGYFTLVNVGSGLCINVPGATTTLGTNIIQEKCGDADSQKWDITDQGSGQYSIISKANSLALDVYGAHKANGTRVIQWSWSGNNNQKWTIGSSSQSASAGCSTSPKFADGRYTLVSDETTREFWVDVPENYNASTPYTLVVGLHWRDGSATDVYNGTGAFYGLKQLYGNSAVFVAPNGLDKGWSNYNDRDIHFIRAMVAQLKQGLCIDNKHIYATGFSFGGMMSNAIGCQMGDTFRAIAPIAGSLWSGCANSSNTVAAIMFHSKADTVVSYHYGEEARDKVLSKNGCSANTTSIGTNGCVEYQGCAAGKPVVWCGYSGGGHWQPNFSAKETKAFFDRF